MDQLQPYFNLTPDHILDALESVGVESEPSLLALNSYENRVYRFQEGDRYRVVKFYRPDRWTDEQILEEHQFSVQLLDADLPVATPLLFSGQTLLNYQSFRFAIFPCLGGREPALDNEQVLRQLGRTMARIHNIGTTEAFHHRNQLSVQLMGNETLQYLQQHQSIPEYLQPSFFSISNQLIDLCNQQLPDAGSYPVIRLHGDCHPGNILWSESGPSFVDLDDAVMGPEIQDLWMLLPNQGEGDILLKEALLAGYSEFRDLDPEQFHWVEALRALRMIHYSGWLAKRWQDPAFKMHFPWFGEPQYWEQQILDLKEQLSVMMEKESSGNY